MQAEPTSKRRRIEVDDADMPDVDGAGVIVQDTQPEAEEVKGSKDKKQRRKPKAAKETKAAEKKPTKRKESKSKKSSKKKKEPEPVEEEEDEEDEEELDGDDCENEDDDETEGSILLANDAGELLVEDSLCNIADCIEGIGENLLDFDESQGELFTLLDKLTKRVQVLEVHTGLKKVKVKNSSERGGQTPTKKTPKPPAEPRPINFGLDA